ncbi:MAG: AmmeMemoRadiSam system radical SAM enzyme [Thermoplasmatota archaeon]
MRKEALFWKPLTDKEVQCSLCPHHCVIQNNGFGICGVRKNENGVLYSMIYAMCSGISDDPIEKKPLNHFYPGSMVLSLGSIGCNFKCLHCQNYSISTASPDTNVLTELSPKKAVELAKNHGCRGIAWTYNEPTIWYEYTFDSAQYAKKAGLYTVYVSNGYINREPLEKISPYLDAINIDVKAFSEDFYKKVCKARLAPVLQTCEHAKNLGIHLELTYLVIPGKNDSLKEITMFCRWVVDTLGPDIPIYFSRFHPNYKMNDVPETSIDSLVSIFEHAKKQGINFVYIGNILDEKYENTICPSCNNVLIKRQVFSSEIVGLLDEKCMKCGAKIPIIAD